MDIAEFFEENYLWLILIAIFILMAIVGYIAERTGFINRNKVIKSKRSNELPIIIEDKGIDELLKENADKGALVSQTEEEVLKEEKPKKTRKSRKSKKEEVAEIEPVAENNAFINEIKEENTDPFVNVPSDELIIQPPVENEEVNVFTNDIVSEDLMSPLVNEEETLENNEIDQALFAPLEGTESNNDTSVSYEEANDSTVVNEEEDIWKF